MSRRLFGTDGVRGRVGTEPITPQTILKLGWAAGRVLGGGAAGKILIGKDTRVSGYMLESVLEAGLSAAGVDISLTGPIPTPGIAYLTRTSRARAGIVISASHNPYDDNGIKFFSGDGYKLPDDVELAIETMMQQPVATVPSSQLGKAERFPDSAGRYIELCKSTIPFGLSFQGLKVVVDCAQGAGYQVAPSVFEELGAEVTAIANEPDGFNINLECGATDTAWLQKTVTERGADLGVALDGDGDRVIMVSASGRRVDGDQILYVLSKTRREQGRLRGGIVGTLMTNFGLELELQRSRVPFARAAVGDRYVLEQMHHRNWELGGETSGHIICLDKSTTGDGIIAALELVQVLVESGRSLDELIEGLEIYPQTLINVRVDPSAFGASDRVEERPAVQQAVRSAAGELRERGRVVLRRSGTEPVIRVMVEANDDALAGRVAGSLAEAVEQAARG